MHKDFVKKVMMWHHFFKTSGEDMTKWILMMMTSCLACEDIYKKIQVEIYKISHEIYDFQMNGDKGIAYWELRGKEKAYMEIRDHLVNYEEKLLSD
jgi:hypothetical protein